jgi:glucokinase
MRAQKYLENNNSKIIDELTNKKRSPITPHILFLAADRGDKIAKEIWSAAGKNLGIFFTTLINFANPDMIVLCGGISKAGKYFIKSAVEEIQRRAFKSAVKICKIKLSQYEHKLGVVGAAMLAKQ